MNLTLESIIKSRNDLSDYVFHFTKYRNAKVVLNKILSDKSIRDINNKGYICFSEAPITMLPAMFGIFKKYNDPMYAPYGIGIKKEFLYSLGGRPVIYGDDNEKNLIAEELQWRFVPYIPGSYDFTWLREWRVNMPSLDINFDNCIVIVNSESEIENEFNISYLDDIDVDAEPDDGGATTFLIGKYKKLFKSISIEAIKQFNLMSKEDIDNYLASENKTEDRLLGSSWH